MATARLKFVNLLRSQGEWCVELLGPVADRVRTVGVLRAAPASLLLAFASLAATASVHLPSPIQHAATGLLAYRGEDFYTGTWWKIPVSGLLAQSWPQWLWTLLVAVVLFAPLEVRVGALQLLTCVMLSQVLSTVVVAVLAQGHADELARPDYGTSCLVVGVAAALAWVRRCRWLTVVIAASLAVDAVLSAPTTAVEHCVAMAAGGLLMIWASPSLATVSPWPGARVTVRAAEPGSGPGRSQATRTGSLPGDANRVATRRRE